MKISYWIGLLMLLACGILSLPVRAQASWPMNTPERQWNPLWAGENVVWNDDRLGSADLFIRGSDGSVKPLVSSPEDQILVAASKDIIAYTELVTGHNRLMTYSLATHAIHQIATDTSVFFASALKQQLTWADNTQVYWWDGKTLFTKPTSGVAPKLTPRGPAWIEGDAVRLWTTGGDQVLPCTACVAVESIDDQIALLDGNGSLHLWPSGMVIAADSTSLTSNGTALVYWSSGASYLYRSGQTMPFRATARGRLGLRGIVTAQSDDVILELESSPTVTMLGSILEATRANLRGTGTAAVLHLRAIPKSGPAITKDLKLSNPEWEVNDLLVSAPDGIYTLTVQPESALGAFGALMTLGEVIVDRTPPRLTAEPEIKSDLDSARIHFVTDEKTAARIEITTSGQENVERTLRQLTFSHTTTFSSLDPGTAYQCRVIVTDQAGNQLEFVRSFRTIGLTDPSIFVAGSDTLVPNASEVWQGRLIVPPGIIDGAIAIVQINDASKEVRWLEWTVGRPPPGLKPGALVRWKGSVNRAGTRILLHRPSAMVQMDDGVAPLYTPLDTSVALSAYQNSWVSISGALTSVAKTGWKLEFGDQAIKIHWEQGPPPDYGRLDIVQISGFLYLDKDQWVLAAVSAEVVARTPQASATHTVAPKRAVVVAPTVAASALAEPVAPPIKSTFTEQSATVYDSGGILWYSIELLALGGIIIERFFFRRRQKITRDATTRKPLG